MYIYTEKRFRCLGLPWYVFV